MKIKNILFALIITHTYLPPLAQTQDETLAWLHQYGNTYLHLSDREDNTEERISMAWNYTYAFYPDRLEEKVVFSGTMIDSGEKYYEDITISTLYYKDILLDNPVTYMVDITRMYSAGSMHQIYIPVKQYQQREEIVLSHREGEAGKITEKNLQGNGTQFTLRCIGEEGKKKADLAVEAILRMAKGIK